MTILSPAPLALRAPLLRSSSSTSSSSSSSPASASASASSASSSASPLLHLPSANQRPLALSDSSAFPAPSVIPPIPPVPATSDSQSPSAAPALAPSTLTTTSSTFSSSTPPPSVPALPARQDVPHSLPFALPPPSLPPASQPFRPLPHHASSLPMPPPPNPLLDPPLRSSDLRLSPFHSSRFVHPPPPARFHSPYPIAPHHRRSHSKPDERRAFYASASFAPPPLSSPSHPTSPTSPSEPALYSSPLTCRHRLSFSSQHSSDSSVPFGAPRSLLDDSLPPRPRRLACDPAYRATLIPPPNPAPSFGVAAAALGLASNPSCPSPILHHSLDLQSDSHPFHPPPCSRSTLSCPPIRPALLPSTSDPLPCSPTGPPPSHSLHFSISDQPLTHSDQRQPVPDRSPALPPNPPAINLRPDLTSLKDGPDGPNGKPGYPYVVLIRYAILGSHRGKLTLQELYEAIMDRFPYYRTAGKGWMNSIRHNLSLNRCFVKQARHILDPGKGSYWTVDLDAEMSTSRARDRKRTSGGSRSSLGSIKSPRMSRRGSLNTGETRSPTFDELLDGPGSSSPGRMLYLSDDELGEASVTTTALHHSTSAGAASSCQALIHQHLPPEDNDGDTTMRMDEPALLPSLSSTPLKSPSSKLAQPKRSSRTPKPKQHQSPHSLKLQIGTHSESGPSSYVSGSPTAPAMPELYRPMDQSTDSPTGPPHHHLQSPFQSQGFMCSDPSDPLGSNSSTTVSPIRRGTQHPISARSLTLASIPLSSAGSHSSSSTCSALPAPTSSHHPFSSGGRLDASPYSLATASSPAYPTNSSASSLVHTSHSIHLPPHSGHGGLALMQASYPTGFSGGFGPPGPLPDHRLFENSHHHHYHHHHHQPASAGPWTGSFHPLYNHPPPQRHGHHQPSQSHSGVYGFQVHGGSLSGGTSSSGGGSATDPGGQRGMGSFSAAVLGGLSAGSGSVLSTNHQHPHPSWSSPRPHSSGSSQHLRSSGLVGSQAVANGCQTPLSNESADGSRRSSVGAGAGGGGSSSSSSGWSGNVTMGNS